MSILYNCYISSTEDFSLFHLSFYSKKSNSQFRKVCNKYEKKAFSYLLDFFAGCARAIS